MSTTTDLCQATAGLVCLVAVAGCASVERTAAMADVDRAVSARIDEHVQWQQNSNEDRAAEAQVRTLLEDELSVQEAVRIALLNNRGLQANYERLGISQADLVQAGMLENPELSLQYLFGDEGDLLEASIIQPLMNVVTLAARKKIGQAQAQQARLEIAQSVLEVALEVRAAYYAVVADAQAIELMGEATRGTEAAADLAARQYRAGNLSRREQALQQIAYAQAALETAQAQARLASDRERLNRLLGLWGEDTRWTVPNRLPEMPAVLPPLDQVERLAVMHRLDLAAAAAEVEAAYRAWGLTRDTRWLSALGIGITFKREPNGEKLLGPEVSLGLPLFDQGQARVARRASELRQSERRLEAMAVDVRSQAREARLRLQAAHEVVMHYRNALLPLQQTVVAETLKFYNGMLIGVYELLAAQQGQAHAAKQYVEASKAFWLTWVDLERAVGTSLPVPAPNAKPASEPTAAMNQHASHTHGEN
jgi:cobalt-zinc-cadmium efflux system outer membrane protein